MGQLPSIEKIAVTASAFTCSIESLRLNLLSSSFAFAIFSSFYSPPSPPPSYASCSWGKRVTPIHGPTHWFASSHSPPLSVSSASTREQRDGDNTVTQQNTTQRRGRAIYKTCKVLYFECNLRKRKHHQCASSHSSLLSLTPLSLSLNLQSAKWIHKKQRERGAA